MLWKESTSRHTDPATLVPENSLPEAVFCPLDRSVLVMPIAHCSMNVEKLLVGDVAVVFVVSHNQLKIFDF